MATPAHPIRHDKEPIRLFKSDFLEFFTHVHPAIVPIVWLPVVIASLIVPVVRHPGTGGLAFILPLGFLIGLFLWTLAEYTLHRFVFHFRPRAPWQERVTFLFHGVHHAQPQEKSRLVMPPPVSIPLALIFYGFFALILAVLLPARAWLGPVFAGFLTGYIIYDLTHYATHHFPMRRGYLKFLKRYHMQHHFKTPNARYGVSSPIWDRVFGTSPRD